MHWQQTVSELIYRPRAANWYAQYAAASLHAVHHSHYMIRHCMAGMQGVSCVITRCGFAFKYIKWHWSSPKAGYANPDSHTGPSHPLTASVRCTLPSLVQWRIPVACQRYVIARCERVACLPPTGASSPGYRLSAAMHLPGAVSKYPLCTGLWPKCGLVRTKPELG